MNWRAVWHHQLRWARTIRVCQPVPYFFSILSNAGFWAVIWLGEVIRQAIQSIQVHDLGGGAFAAHVRPGPWVYPAAAFCLARIVIACKLQSRLTGASDGNNFFWLVPLKDLLQGAIWLCAFIGNKIEWRGQVYRLRRDGTLVNTGSNEERGKAGTEI